ncbi:unnamed protein product [Cyprideis torosa]|uniref:Uncharacterized protein n=1 Tax=Cyprideis torosa TaxID=163714 RepID=A0A7R8ZH43_9CRUS|nr:unnamed protein product [Cyprideis torosa]CAG0882820.1 unnamed protein product [Cyprideis torosa]
MHQACAFLLCLFAVSVLAQISDPIPSNVIEEYLRQQRARLELQQQHQSPQVQPTASQHTGAGATATGPGPTNGGNGRTLNSIVGALQQAILQRSIQRQAAAQQAASQHHQQTHGQSPVNGNSINGGMTASGPGATPNGVPNHSFHSQHTAVTPAPFIPPQTTTLATSPTFEQQQRLLRETQPPLPTEELKKPVFRWKCQDCNIAVTDKEILEFMNKILEMLTQPGMGFRDVNGNQAFDGECINCNLLVGTHESVANAANRMFEQIRTSQKGTPGTFTFTP